MITIQETIKKAIDIKGAEILKDKDRFCMLLEDLSPTLREDREFLEKTYSDAVGRILYGAYQAGPAQENSYFTEADTYLEEEFGYHEKWRKRFLVCFRSALLSAASQQGESVLLERHTLAEWMELADKGNAAAQWKLGIMYAEGEQTDVDWKKAVYWFKEAVDGGYPDAFCSLAYCLENGDGIERDVERAYRLYEQGVRLGSAACMRNLGIAYREGQFYRNDIKKVYSSSELSHLKKYLPVMEEIQRNGYMVRADRKRSDSLFEDSFRIYLGKAQEGYPYAQYQCGCCYRSGRGTGNDEAEAKRWFEMAAANGYRYALVELAEMYLWGREPEKQRLKREYIKKAMEFDNAEIWKKIGIWCTELGFQVTDSKEQDFKEGIYWNRKAAERGVAESQYMLGRCYDLGRGVEKDDRKAAEWYEKAAVQGNCKAQRIMGIRYREGEGVGKDCKKAVQRLTEAAVQGDAEAQYNLGCMYRFGEGIEADYEKAAKWFREAAMQDNRKAQNHLGYMYRNGFGVRRDDREAFEWFELSAGVYDYLPGAGGEANAQCHLGYMYENGLGTERDEKKALLWYEKAAAQGDEYAAGALKRISRQGG